MTRFYVYFTQSGGCDYTIDCGKKLVPLPDTVKTMEEAKALVLGFQGDDDDPRFKSYQLGYYGDEVDEAIILQVESIEVVKNT